MDVFDQEAERLQHLKVMSTQMSQLAGYLYRAGCIPVEVRTVCALRAHDCWVAESSHWDSTKFDECRHEPRF